MNILVDEIVTHCYECQVITKQHVKEPLKMTEIPEKPWKVESIDFGGPYPDGYYNLVVVDKRTRYPDIETLWNNSMQANEGNSVGYFQHIEHRGE